MGRSWKSLLEMFGAQTMIYAKSILAKHNRMEGRWRKVSENIVCIRAIMYVEWNSVCFD